MPGDPVFAGWFVESVRLGIRRDRQGRRRAAPLRLKGATEAAWQVPNHGNASRPHWRTSQAAVALVGCYGADDERQADD